MDLLEGFFKFLKTQHWSLDERSPTLLTLSGGVDSVVMARLFQDAKLPFAVAHCNFQLRGAESDEDELFVQQIALDVEAPFFIKRFDTKAYAEKNGLSTQMAARELRYEWFAEIAAENRFDHIATAHHLNDSVETMLLNLIRGTGLAGLSGIKPVSQLPTEKLQTRASLIRPLLFARRTEIMNFARSRDLNWREDSSNAFDEYARNYVRHHIVPLMEALNPNFLHTAARSMERIGEAADNLAFLSEEYFSDGAAPPHPVTKIPKPKLALLPSPEQALRQLLKPYGFDAEQARQLAENMDHVGLELKNEKGWELLNDRKEIVLRNTVKNNAKHDTGTPTEPTQQDPVILIQEDDLMLSLPDGSRLFLMSTPNPESPSPHSITISAEKLSFPLHLRHWQPGDSFQPLGMGGQKQKLQDFFTNQKLSRFEKEAVWLLVNGDGAVIWVLGWRMDERFKIREETKGAVKIVWELNPLEPRFTKK